MAFTWRFNPDSSSATGLSADSASSARFSNAFFSVSQLTRYVLNPSLSCSMDAKAVFELILGLGSFGLLGFDVFLKISSLGFFFAQLNL